MTTRSQNAARNSIIGFFAAVISILASFGSRLLFAHYLDVVYLGYNGLFTSIVSVLSIAELGISSAITYRLYKPIAEDDRGTVHTLVTIYKKFYFYIAMFMVIAGVFVSSFIQIFIKEGVKNLPQLRILFLLFLANTVVSYFFAHKRSLLFALQSNRTIQIVDSVCKLLALVTQWFVLIRTHSFEAFLIINVIYSLLSGLLISFECDKRYNVGRIRITEPTDKDLKNNIFSDIKNVFLIKISGVAVQSGDSLIISSVISNLLAGLYSNYQLVITSVNTLALAVIEGAIAPLGDLLNNERRDASYAVIKTFCFITSVIAVFCSVEMITLLPKFIRLAFGSSFLIDSTTMVLAVVAFFIHFNREPLYQLINLTGSFHYYSKLAITEAILNVILSLALAVHYGITGVIAATVICRIYGMTLQLYICYHRIIDTEFKTWYPKNLLTCFLLMAVLSFACNYLLEVIHTPDSILFWIVDALIVAAVTILAMILILQHNPEFKNLKDYIRKLIIH